MLEIFYYLVATQLHGLKVAKSRLRGFVELEVLAKSATSITLVK
jgi:hypothetical protein